MSNWISNPDAQAKNIIDHVTHFRLSRAPHHHLADPDAVWWSVLIELEGISITQFEASVAEYATDLLVPVAYDTEDRGKVLPLQPVTIYARAPLIKRLNDRGSDLHIASVWLGAITPSRFLDHDAQPEPQREVTVENGTVVQAFIDDGIAISHDLFRSGATSSRIHHARIFEAEPLAKSRTSVGRGLDRKDIDALLRECTFGGMLDEDLFYARSGQVDLARDVFSTVALRRSHGTHIMALAAGNPMTGPCDGNPIICAALPSRVVQDTTGLDMLPMLYLAFHILVKQARRFRTKGGALAPVVFNFSYGNTGGPHDGTGVFATMFEYYFGKGADAGRGEKQRAWLTLPAGNGNLGRLHAIDEVDQTGGSAPVTLDLSVLPDDRTPTHVQIWMPASPEGDQHTLAKITVRAPFGGDVGMIETQAGQHAALVNSAGQQVARLAYQYVAGTTGRGLVTLSINPTANLIETFDLAPAGLWTIEVERLHSASRDPIHIWVRRDDTLPGQVPGGRQAFFSNPDYKRFGPYGEPLAVDPPDTTSPVRRAGTISGFSCGASPIVVAAYTEQEAVLSAYSAAGPLNPNPEAADPHRDGPDLAARGDDSLVLRGVQSAGSRSGSWVRLAGTSVAAPLVARVAAEHIAEDTKEGRVWAREAAKRYAFDLKGNPSATRVGAGAVKFPDAEL